MKLYHKVKAELIADWKALEQPILLHYTGSMFGVGCDAAKEPAVKKLDALKQRKKGSGYIVLIYDIALLNQFDAEMNKALRGLVTQYSPGALTVVLPCSDERLKHLQLKGKIAFRIPEDAGLRDFLQQMEIPLISTSINKSGHEPEIDIRHIMKEYQEWFDLALIPDDELIAEGQPSTVITVEDEKLVCLREGKLPFSELEEDYYHPQVTFLCTGNICRSPLAEYYFRRQVEEKALSWRAASCGLLQSDVPISENSRILLEQDGIDASAHRSQEITKDCVKRSRLVLTMTAQQKNTLENAGWNSQNNIFTLGEFVGHNQDIKDPYQQNIEAYETAYWQIKFYIDLLLERLENF